MRKIKGWLDKKLLEWKGYIAGNNAGLGTVEIILIIVVLIGLVIIFKEQLNDLVNDIFDKITKQAKKI